MRVGPPLAYIELTLLSVLTLWLALQPLSPVPRPWATASAALMAAQTAAVRGIALEPRTPGVPVDGREALDTVAEGELHAHPLAPEPPRIAHEAAHLLARGGQPPQHRAADPPRRARQEDHAARL